jgi:hypothetical protein
VKDAPSITGWFMFHVKHQDKICMKANADVCYTALDRTAPGKRLGTFVSLPLAALFIGRLANWRLPMFTSISYLRIQIIIRGKRLQERIITVRIGVLWVVQIVSLHSIAFTDKLFSIKRKEYLNRHGATGILRRKMWIHRHGSFLLHYPSAPLHA